VIAVGVRADAAGVSSLAAVRLDGGTGAEEWRRLLQGSDGHGSGRAVAIAPDGDVVVGGQFRNTRSCYDLSFARLAGETGEILDVRSVDGTTVASQCDLPPECRFVPGDVPCGPPRAGIDVDTLSAVAVDADGRIVVAGYVSDGRRGRQRGLVASIR
jgi:hypothetical protein